jgi:hypothetical protein
MANLSVAWAEGTSRSITTIDGLEYTIELNRHERLIKARTARDATLTAFASDGCSGGLSAGWKLFSSAVPAIAKRSGDRPPWENCCVAHDRVYHTGGPPKVDATISFEARRTADEELRQCVIRVGEERLQTLMAEYGLTADQASLAYRTIADLMYRAVRIGGAPCTGLPWRWGFGWPACE